MTDDFNSITPAGRVMPADVARFGIGARSGRTGTALADIGYAFFGAYRSRGALSIAQRRSFGVLESDARAPAVTSSHRAPEILVNSISSAGSSTVRTHDSPASPTPKNIRHVACNRIATLQPEHDADVKSARSPRSPSIAKGPRTTLARALFADIRVVAPTATLRMVIACGRTYFALMPCR